MKLFCNYDSPNINTIKGKFVQRRIRGNKIFFSAVKKETNHPYTKFLYDNEFTQWNNHKGKVIENKDIPIQIGNTSPITF